MRNLLELIISVVTQLTDGRKALQALQHFDVVFLIPGCPCSPTAVQIGAVI